MGLEGDVHTGERVHARLFHSQDLFFFFFAVGTMGAWRENTHTISLMTLYSKKGFNRISKKVSTLYSNRLYGPNN